MTGRRTIAVAVASLSLATVGVSAQQTARRNTAWRDIQGLNIVLVVGESQRSGTSSDELPNGARRALSDMREFLPYRHYRVLDSQWTSCCSSDVMRVGSAIAGRLQGVTAGAGPSGTTVLVPRSYAFSVTLTQSTEASGLSVRFTLRQEDGGSGRGGSQARVADVALEGRAANLRADLEILSNQVREAQRRHEAGVLPTSELRQLQDRHAQAERRLAEAMNSIAGQGGGGSSRPIIDSSFTMDVGETVVVGTSRLGGDKALIALVTAVRRTTSSR